MKNITNESWLRVSSFRSGHEAINLIDNSKDTFWQSDDQLPHWLQFDFDTRQNLKEIRLLFDWKKDETYIPSTIIIQGGDHQAFLHDYQQIEIEPNNNPWFIISLNNFNVYTMRLLIKGNNANGKDSRIRCINLFSKN